MMIAAVVSTYVGGFSGGAEKSPQSTIRVTPNLGQDRISFEHDGGDPFMLSSVNVVLRANDNKTSLSLNDAGGSFVRKFEAVGSSGGNADTTIKAGDAFFIEGDDFGSRSGIQFGSMILTNNTKITGLSWTRRRARPSRWVNSIFETK